MNVFISYRRKNWPLARQLKAGLRKRLNAKVFLDFQNIDQTRFKESILRNLRESHVFLLIVTEYTFAPERIHHEDDWIRIEIREALRLGIPIVVVWVDGQGIPGDIPHDIAGIREMQAVNFYPDYYAPAMLKLVSFITQVTALKPTNLIAEKEKLEATLKPIVTGLIKIQAGKLANVYELLDEFQSYLTSIEDLLFQTQPLPPSADGSEKTPLEDTQLFLADIIRQAAAAPDKVPADTPSVLPHEPLPERDPLADLDHLSSLATPDDSNAQVDPSTWLYPPRPPATNAP